MDSSAMRFARAMQAHTALFAHFNLQDPVAFCGAVHKRLEKAGECSAEPEARWDRGTGRTTMLLISAWVAARPVEGPHPTLFVAATEDDAHSARETLAVWTDLADMDVSPVEVLSRGEFNRAVREGNPYARHTIIYDHTQPMGV